LSAIIKEVPAWSGNFPESEDLDADEDLSVLTWIHVERFGKSKQVAEEPVRPPNKCKHFKKYFLTFIPNKSKHFKNTF
jgi:hypothetical protein